LHARTHTAPNRAVENVCENNVDVDRYEHLLKEGIDFTRH